MTLRTESLKIASNFFLIKRSKLVRQFLENLSASHEKELEERNNRLIQSLTCVREFRVGNIKWSHESSRNITNISIQKNVKETSD